METRGFRDDAPIWCTWCGAFMWHTFYKLRPAKHISVKGRESDALEEVYKCLSCGKTRRWGMIGLLDQEKKEES